MKIQGRNAKNFKGKICTISGSGNVAQYTAEKLIGKGANIGGFVKVADAMMAQGLV